MLTKTLPKYIEHSANNYDEIWGNFLQSLYDDGLIDKNGSIIGESK